MGYLARTGLPTRSMNHACIPRLSTAHRCTYSAKWDNFAISAPALDHGNKLLSMIQTHLTQPMKHLGTLTMYNGLDVTQADKFIKVFYRTYLRKVLEGQRWLSDSSNPVSTPMQSKAAFLRSLDTSTGRKRTAPFTRLYGIFVPTSCRQAPFCGGDVLSRHHVCRYTA